MINSFNTVTKLKYLPVPVNEYGSHVKQLHANKNHLFDRQFEVSLVAVCTYSPYLCNNEFLIWCFKI